MRGTLRGEPRIVRVAAAQMGPIQREHTRADAVARLCALLNRAADLGATLVVFPELALTTFFPRWFVDDISTTDHYYERAMPSADTAPLFQLAKQRRVGFSLGYAELTSDGHRYNTPVLVDRDGGVVAKYRKVHIPGHASNEPGRPFQHAERYYFEPSDEGFGV
ncbi:MAG: nitrilase-related carbon-nitrogen hydrolase, partial [Actinomycetota bacterium]